MSIFIILAVMILMLVFFLYFVYSSESKQEPKILTSPSIMFQKMSDEHVIDTLRKIERQAVEEDPPEIRRLETLLNDFKKNHSWDFLIAVGDIYKNGAYPRFLPNEHIALNCYKIAAMCPDGDVSGLGQVKYIETRSEHLISEDKKGKPLPIRYGEEICELAMIKIQNTHYSQFDKPKQIKQIERPTRQEVHREDYFDIFEIDDFGYDFVPMVPMVQTVPTPAFTPVYRIDSQNVHDHSVMSIAKKNLDNIVKNSKVASEDIKINELKKMILSHPEVSSRQASDAIQVLQSLSSTTHSTFDKSEKQVLAGVIDKINETQDNTLRSNLIETLGKQLASGVENGHVVCSTGKITRMLGTFDGSDVEGIESIRPLWAIKEELATLAAKVRDEHTGNLSENQLLAYDRGELPQLDKKMKEEFKQKAENIYYGELHMNPKIINPIIENLQEAF